MTTRASLIMPLFNGGLTVERAVRSVLAQSSPDWELIIVDDNSSDDGPDVVRRLMAEPGGEKLHLVLHEENAGPSAARNTGISRATGTYIGFLDCDDELLPTFLSVMAGEFNDEVDIVIAAHVAQTSTGQRRVRPDSLQGSFTGLQATRAALEARLWNYLHAKLYRRSLLLEVSFPHELARYEDLVFNATAYSFSRNIKIISDPVYIYHIQLGSLTWSQEPSLKFVLEPLAMIQSGLNPLISIQLGHRPWNTLRTFLGVLTYSGGLFAMGSGAKNKEVAGYVKSSLSSLQLLNASTAAPHLGISGLVIKMWPALYAYLYRWHVRRRFSMAG